VGVPQWSAATATAENYDHESGNTTTSRLGGGYSWGCPEDEEEGVGHGGTTGQERVVGKKAAGSAGAGGLTVQPQHHFEFAHDWRYVTRNVTSSQVLHLKIVRTETAGGRFSVDGAAKVEGYVTVPLQWVYEQNRKQKQRLAHEQQENAGGGSRAENEDAEDEICPLGTLVETYNITDVRDPHLKFQHYSANNCHGGDEYSKHEHSRHEHSKHEHSRHEYSKHVVGTTRLRLAVLGELAHSAVQRHALTVEVINADLHHLSLPLLLTQLSHHSNTHTTTPHTTHR
jgi:hypothetical protein